MWNHQSFHWNVFDFIASQIKGFEMGKVKNNRWEFNKLIVGQAKPF